MEKLIDLAQEPVTSLLPLLLKDKTTRKNIIWATGAYAERGEGFFDRQEMNPGELLAHLDIIKPRIAKSQETQQERTRKKAEVFTPVWLCNQMNNYCDEEWFGRKNVFNIENPDHTWSVVEERIVHPGKKPWQNYINSRRLEITCGEAPFLVSRYDASTGLLIEPPKRRIGILDRKLRIVNENTDSKEEWTKWAVRAYESVYGYEYQGDNLLIARINLLLTFLDYYRDRWGEDPDVQLLKKLCNKISWNIWQMDGLHDTVPLGKPEETYHQMSLFEMTAQPDKAEDGIAPFCRIQDWRADRSVIFHSLKGEK